MKIDISSCLESVTTNGKIILEWILNDLIRKCKINKQKLFPYGF